MKNFLLLLFVTVSFTAFSQSNAHDFNVNNALKAIKAKVTLTTNQESKITTLLESKKSNIESVASLKMTDIKKYIGKRNAINDGMHFSIKRLLNKDQVSYFQSYLTGLRLDKANLRSSMKKEGKTQIEIDLATAEL